MHFVDNIYFITSIYGRKSNFFAQIADFINAAVGSCVDFKHIHGCAVIYAHAVLAFIAGVRRRPVFAVNSLGQNFCRTGFASTARPGKQIGMGYATSFQRIGKRSTHCLLPYEGIEPLRAPLSV